MKRLLLALILVGVCTSISFADYTHEIYSYGENETLDGDESILVDLQGGMDGLTLFGNSSADIKGTSTLGDGTGGIWYLSLSGDSHLDFFGGQVHRLTMNGTDDATAILSGGTIEEIWNYQIPWDEIGDPPVQIPDPHITIDCLDWFHNITTDILTGHWNDVGNTEFTIQLHDVDGYPDVIDNIQFIPEPATLMLLGIGSLLLRKRK
jgi:hypothetical protein